MDELSENEQFRLMIELRLFEIQNQLKNMSKSDFEEIQ